MKGLPGMHWERSLASGHALGEKDPMCLTWMHGNKHFKRIRTLSNIAATDHKEVQGHAERVGKRSARSGPNLPPGLS